MDTCVREAQAEVSRVLGEVADLRAARRDSERVDELFAQLWAGDWLTRRTFVLFAGVSLATAVLLALTRIMKALASRRSRARRDPPEQETYEKANYFLRDAALVMHPSNDGRTKNLLGVVLWGAPTLAVYAFVLFAFAAAVLDDGYRPEAAAEYDSSWSTNPLKSAVTAFLRWTGVADVAWQAMHFGILSVCGGVLYMAVLKTFGMTAGYFAEAHRLTARSIRAHALAILLAGHGQNRQQITKAVNDDQVLQLMDGKVQGVTGAAALRNVGDTVARITKDSSPPREEGASTPAVPAIDN